MKRHAERGQALIIIALAFIGLVAFVGLTVDGGILFAQIGHLRRGVDAAALGAANQYRRTTSTAELEATVHQLLRLNNIDPSVASTLEINVCDLPAYDPDLSALHAAHMCPDANPWDYERKLVEVVIDYPVNFVFLPIIGWDSVDIHARAIGEAASVDLVLVLDTSSSMDKDGDPASCNPDSCDPFEDVRAAALGFVNQLYFPYDHVSVIHFDNVGHTPQEIGFPSSPEVWLTDDKTVADDAINALEVFERQPCTTFPNPGGCLSTNVQEGLLQAASALANDGRDESLWVVVLLTDGAANQARYDINGDGAIANDEWLCPNPDADGVNDDQEPTWIEPYCRDGDATSRHSDTSEWYDVEDATKDVADILGCLSTSNPGYGGSWCDDNGVTNGYEALMFTIGMGPKVLEEECADGEGDEPDYYDSTPPYTSGPPCHVDMGERLLRYIAAVGDDSDPTTNPCAGSSAGSDCGNYFYAPTSGDLNDIFATIANRIYTRITE